MEEKEYVSFYVPKEQAERVKRAQGKADEYTMIEELIASTNKSLKDDLAGLDDDVLRFKGMLLAYKDAYRKALEENRDAVYALWEKIDESLPDMKQKAKVLVGGLGEVMPQLVEALEVTKSITKALESTNTYQLQRMVELVSAIQNTDDKTKDILRAVLNSPQYDPSK